MQIQSYLSLLKNPEVPSPCGMQKIHLPGHSLLGGPWSGLDLPLQSQGLSLSWLEDTGFPSFPPTPQMVVTISSSLHVAGFSSIQLQLNHDLP